MNHEWVTSQITRQHIDDLAAEAAAHRAVAGRTDDAGPRLVARLATILRLRRRPVPASALR